MAKRRRRKAADDESATIHADGLAGLYLAACPSFEARWTYIANDAGNVDEDGARIPYADAADFVRHVAELEVAGRREEFPAVFRMIERLVTNGDPYVQELAVIGILESFLMATVAELGVDPEVAFRPFFGPASAHWWARLDRFWAGDPTALQDDG